MTESMPRPNSGSAIRGVLLVGIAIAVGVLLLRSSDTGNAVTTASADDGATAPGVTQAIVPETTGDTTASATGDTTAPATGDTTAPATDDTTAPATDDTTAGATDDTTASADGSEETVPTVTGFTPRPAAEVRVQVANSTAVRGAAGTMTDRFNTLNYITLTPTNFRGTALDRTRVYYQPGSLLEAQAVAEVLELDQRNDVFQMFQDTSALDAWEDADVLLVLGNDLASAE